jgi:hypothetical protein
MIVLRNKLFFNYGDFAKRYGNQAAEELRVRRNNLAQGLNQSRQAINETAQIAKKVGDSHYRANTAWRSQMFYDNLAKDAERSIAKKYNKGFTRLKNLVLRNSKR